jgi:hypothetical protein
MCKLLMGNPMPSMGNVTLIYIIQMNKILKTIMFSMCLDLEKIVTCKDQDKCHINRIFDS